MARNPHPSPLRPALIMVAVLLTAAATLALVQRPLDARRTPQGQEAHPAKAEAKRGNNEPRRRIQKVTKTDQQWKEQLSAEAYQVLRKKGTERPFSGKYNQHKAEGTYRCAGCGLPLFTSEAKYDSGSGWPSFTQPLDRAHVAEETDRSHGMMRTEVLCARCGGHLGHVFNDGPRPTGLRYCINSVSLEFKPTDQDEDKER